MKAKQILGFTVTLAMIAATITACGSQDDEKKPDPSELHTAVTSTLSMAENVKAYLEKIDMEYAYDLAVKMAYDKEYWDNDLGWRSSGSDAEHRAADFLVEEMKRIGLQDVEKVATKVDKFQFNDSKLTLQGTEIDLMPASYQCNGTDADGITAEIVDVGTGFESDYQGKDVTGKLVLAEVNQWDDSWIDGYIRQAHEKGAAALITYSAEGHGTLNQDTINVQDICCGDLIPTVAISANQAKEIQDAIQSGSKTATLMVDAVMEEGTGTTYNVVGTIKGKSSDQQIMLSSHYDKYWYGFQDNSAAVALTFTVAKAMIDSGYQPENDIIVVAHGAEEWGVSNSQYDWAIGSWGMIHDARPEWAGKTLAMLNCEHPAYAEDNLLFMMTVPEFKTLTTKLVKESGLFVKSGDINLDNDPVNVSNSEDGISYRWHGVPYVLNRHGSPYIDANETYMRQRYHTSFDDQDTWDEDAMKTNINWYGAMAMYLDTMPALELDLTATCDDLTTNLNDKVAEAAGVDTKQYLDQVNVLREAAKAHNEKIADINARYEKAVASDASEQEITKIREEGKAINQVSLQAFQAVQEEYLKTDDGGVYIGHPNVNTNAELLQQIIAGLEKQELYTEDETGALDLAWQLNSARDYNYYLFSKNVADGIGQMYNADKVPPDKSYWGTGKMVPLCEVGDRTYQLVRQAEDETAKVDFAAAIQVYQAALDRTLKDVQTYAEAEMAGMQEIADLLN